MNTNKSLNFNHYLYVILYFLDFFTTWLVVSKLIVKYKDYIFPKALVNALGSSFPPFVIGFIWFINICYIVILTETIFYLLKKEKTREHGVKGGLLLVGGAFLLDVVCLPAEVLYWIGREIYRRF